MPFTVPETQQMLVLSTSHVRGMTAKMFDDPAAPDAPVAHMKWQYTVSRDEMLDLVLAQRTELKMAFAMNMMEEIIRLRAALKLTDEEREALLYVDRVLDVQWMTHMKPEPTVTDHVAQCVKAREVLARFMGGKR